MIRHLRNSLRVTCATVCLISFIQSNVLAESASTILSKDEKLRRILSVATSLPEEKIYYRWQSETSGTTLLNEAQYTQKRFDYFMQMTVDPSHFAMGRGIYYAEDITSSAQFIRGEGKGSLIEVHLEKGTPTLDLTSQETLKRLEALGVTIGDIRDLDPPLTVRYNAEGWWVIKKREGVKFQEFDSKRLSVASLLQAKETIAGNARALEVLEPAIKKRLFGPSETPQKVLAEMPLAYTYLTDQEFTSALQAKPELINLYEAKFIDGSLKNLPAQHVSSLYEKLRASGSTVSAESVIRTLPFAEKSRMALLLYDGKSPPVSVLREVIAAAPRAGSISPGDKQSFQALLSLGFSSNAGDVELIRKMDSFFAGSNIHADSRGLQFYASLPSDHRAAMGNYVRSYLREVVKQLGISPQREIALNQLLIGGYKGADLLEAIDKAVGLKLSKAAQLAFEKVALQDLQQNLEKNGRHLSRLDELVPNLSTATIEQVNRICQNLNSWKNACARGRNNSSSLAQVANYHLTSPNHYVEIWESSLRENHWLSDDLLKQPLPAGLTFEQTRRIAESYRAASPARQKSFAVAYEQIQSLNTSLNPKLDCRQIFKKIGAMFTKKAR